MATLNIMSWNIESISEKSLLIKSGKLKFDFANIMAQLVKSQNIDLFMIMEVSPSSTSAIAHVVQEALNAMEGSGTFKWAVWNTDPTGKDVPIPDEILVSLFPKKSCDLSAYYNKSASGIETPMYAAYETTKNLLGDDIWKLRSTRNKNKDWLVKEALLSCGLSRHDIETYLCFFRFDTQPNMSTFWNSAIKVGLQGFSCSLRSTDASGKELGYQDPNSDYNGRTPALFQMFTGDTTNPNYFGIIEFHAPFGASVGPRVIANNNLASIGALSGTGGITKVNMMNAPIAMICGDLNVDYDGDPYTGITLPIPSSATNTKRTYGYFVATGFQLAIQEKSSLKTIASVRSSWTDPKLFRASAYDQIAVRLNGGSITSSKILDIVALLSDPVAAKNVMGTIWPSSTPVYDAFVFYRNEMSDHLPAVANLSF